MVQRSAWLLAGLLVLGGCASPAEEAERLLQQQESRFIEYQQELEDQHKRWLQLKTTRTTYQDSLLTVHQDCIARHNQLLAELGRLEGQLTDQTADPDALLENIRALRAEHGQLRREAEEVERAWPVPASK